MKLWADIKCFFKVLQVLLGVFALGVICGWLWEPPTWTQNALAVCREKVEQVRTAMGTSDEVLRGPSQD